MDLKAFFFTLTSSITLNLAAQPNIRVEVSADTILVGQTVEVTYTIENGDGQFKQPDMKKLPVISGPNSASSFMYANGKTTSSQSYSYTLMGLEPGMLKIPGTTYFSGKDNLAIEGITVFVAGEDGVKSKVGKKDEPQKPATTREKRKF